MYKTKHNFTVRRSFTNKNVNIGNKSFFNSDRPMEYTIIFRYLILTEYCRFFRYLISRKILQGQVMNISIQLMINSCFVKRALDISWYLYYVCKNVPFSLSFGLILKCSFNQLSKLTIAKKQTPLNLILYPYHVTSRIFIIIS